MTDLVNYVKLNDDNTLTGNIASISYDIDFDGVPYNGRNDKAPVYRLYASSPRKRRIEIGVVFRNISQRETAYLSVSINTGNGILKANLGRYPEQDDESLMSIIPWD